MASDREFVEYITDQMADAGNVRFKSMFGEYGIFSNDKIVALVCDNQLFIKPTEAGRSFIGDVVEAPPYAGAKNSFLIGDQIDDGEWLAQLVRLTEAERPKPKPRKKKKKKR